MTIIAVGGLARNHILDDLGLVEGGGLRVAGLTSQPDVVVERRLTFWIVQHDRVVTGSLVLEERTTVTIQIRPEVLCDCVGATGAPLYDAIDPRRVVELAGVVFQFCEGLGSLKPSLLVEIAPVIEHRNEWGNRHRHQLAGGCHRLLCRVEVDGVAQGVDFGIELEARIDVADGFDEATEIHLGEPARIHDEKIVLALAGRGPSYAASLMSRQKD